MARDSRLALALALVVGGVGTLHFAVPKFFDALIPRALPGTPRAWTYGSGVAELGLRRRRRHTPHPPLRRDVDGVAVHRRFPGNVKMAVDYRRARKPLAMRIGTLLRLPLQVPLVLWALRVRNRAQEPRHVSAL